ncbi:MAG: pyrimidine-nucleoside phosphorylase [Acidobacteria bacterium]|nr:pyrimidine-nucleoside phosphorylase [Acidobacteriota bacterium]
MRAVDIIKKKRDGEALTPAEIAFMIAEYSSDRIPDYQMAAFNMAVFFRDMTDGETAALTEAMMQSGEVIDLSEIPGRKVDKHSTGGVGDKTSLIIAPLVAATGIPVPMISGRGLGHTGGTLDKLESIPGFRVDLSLAEYKRALHETRMALIGQTNEIAPADKKLYALRDVTATVESIPLIVGSIMSKKLAEGIDALVLDVKTGCGAFMKREADAERLARAMVNTGKRMGKEVIALLTDMDQPLGNYVGNALEIIESVETLKGRGPADLTTLSIELAAYMLKLGGGAATLDEARQRLRSLIQSGAGFVKFQEIVRVQGGDPWALEDYSRLPQARHVAPVAALGSGFVSRLDAEQIGRAVMQLGAGRDRVDAVIDHSVGLVLHKKIGDSVIQGEPLGMVHYNDPARFQSVESMIAGAFKFSPTPVQKPTLVKKVIT